MFTGIVDHCGTIVECGLGGRSLRVETRFSDFSPGESICVDGVCLTVTESAGNTFCCDLSPETLDRSIAGGYGQGDLVNLERALQVGDRFGGHFVTGHVDQTISVKQKRVHGEFIEFLLGPLESPFVLEKGSIAVNGVSLTINKVSGGLISLMLIPHTLELTNLSGLEVGKAVNIEFDWMTKAIINRIDETRSLLGEKNQ